MSVTELVKIVIGAAGASEAIKSFDQALNNQNNVVNQTFSFPEDLIQQSANRSFYIQFYFSSYQKRPLDQRGSLKFESGMRLPMPSQLKDNTNISYDESAELGAMIGGATDQLLHNKSGISNFTNGVLNSINSLTSGNFENAGSTLKSTLENISPSGVVTGGASTIQSLGAGALFDLARTKGGVAGLVYNGVSQAAGIAVNPFLGVAFKSPSFKKHSFSWRLVARTENESILIKKIINTFKYNSLPGMQTTNSFLFTYPNIVNVQLFPSDEYLYTFKPCVVTNVNVNYAPGNTPSFYKKTNAPTMVELSIDLTEIEYWIKSDISVNGINSTSKITPQVNGPSFIPDISRNDKTPQTPVNTFIPDNPSFGYGSIGDRAPVTGETTFSEATFTNGTRSF
jgi:hypothetical protein